MNGRQVTRNLRCVAAGVLCLLFAGCAVKKPVQVQLKERTCMEGSFPIVGIHNGEKVTVCAVVDPKTHQVVDIVDVGFRPGDADEEDKKTGKDHE
jgi:hypothetical protein